MASPGKRHSANCIGALWFPIELFQRNRSATRTCPQTKRCLFVIRSLYGIGAYCSFVNLYRLPSSFCRNA